ncbi:hypothetical protein, partial [Clostridioides difficile]|uniref:hypothetical protein n=1 Tax=Clostridioides difficile TaxID=1496 RepID=UPI001CA56A0B
ALADIGLAINIDIANPSDNNFFNFTISPPFSYHSIKLYNKNILYVVENTNYFYSINDIK